MKLKICIITGSRSEWGLFYPLAKAIQERPKNFTLQIMATGAHLSKSFGMTFEEIIKDGFKINVKVSLLESKDTPRAILGAVSNGIPKIAAGLERLRPDLVFLLGDRFETFAAATACLFLRIPIAHLHGGELTRGSLDDAMRHAITKMSYLHFASAEEYRRRIIQMGEEPSRVFTVGALGLDNAKNTPRLKRKEFEDSIGFKLGSRNALVTFHPPTSERVETSRDQLKNLMKAIERMPDTRIIFTKPNPDIASQAIAGLLEGFVRKNRDRMTFVTSLGRKRYLSALGLVDVVAGNSSSGIIEAPSFKIPTINIGSRQEGRVRPESVIDVDGDYTSIKNAFERAFSEKFKKTCAAQRNPYGDGHAAERIIRILLKMSSKIKTPDKKFCDLKVKLS